MVEAGTANEEVRVYQRDGNSMVRQTTNEAVEVTYAWSYTPEGMVLIGEEGTVTHLDCGADAIYDWSTGLIFKNGGYFDPTLGIWITLTPFVVWRSRGSRRKKRGREKASISLLVFVFVALIGAGCTNSDPDCPRYDPNPTPFSPLTIDIGFILVNGTTRTNADLERQIGVANSKFAQAGVTIRNDGIFELDEMDPTRPDLSKDLIGEELEVDVSLGVHEEVGLFAWNIATSQATIFYVKSIFPTNYDGFTEGSNILIADRANDRTLPHEVGHAFGLGHPENEPFNLHGLMPEDYPKNLMAQSLDATGEDELSIIQIERLRESIQVGQ